jgi:hypothetical protein
MMRPNTPHFVVTPESAICHGGHFYAMSTIRDTIFGMYHMFVASKNITNTEHTQDAHLLLRRLVVYAHYVFVKRGSDLDLRATRTPHVPNVSTFEGAIDLFMLCVIMELGDLMNPLAYQKKYRRKHDRDYDRLCTIHSRGLARDLRNWWRGHYIFHDIQAGCQVDGELVFKDLFSQQANALIAYKKMAEKNNIHGEALECTAEVLESLVKKYFPHVAVCHEIPETGFEWSGARYEVQAQIDHITSYTSPNGGYSSFGDYYFFENHNCRSGYLRPWSNCFRPRFCTTVHKIGC